MQLSEKKQELKRHRLLFFLTLIATISYMVWRIFFTIPTRFGVVALIFAILLLLSEAMASFEAVVNYSMLSKYVPPEMPEIDDDMYPDIDIMIATHNEPVDMLYTTINACTFLDYPDKNKVHIHLCDDTNRPEMAALAKELGVSYYGLSGNKHAKSGNLNNAIRQTHAPIIITLDADMIPRSEFLMKTVPFFFMPVMKKTPEGKWVHKDESEIDPNEKLGFLQTPQGFYNPDLFQYNLYSEDRIPGEQDLFFREINVARSTYNAPIYAGSNTLISREALEKVGYIAINTITEDMLTGMRIQKEGYTCIATPEVLVQGQAPINIKTLLKQRERWGRGAVDAFRQESVLFSRKLTIAQKISYLGCLVYWWTFLRRAIFLAAPILAVLFNLHVVEGSTWQVFAFWLPYYLLFNRSLRVMSGDVWNQHWSNVADTVMFPYLIGPIFAEMFGFKQKKFSVTEKAVKKTTSKSTFVYGIPHLFFLALMVIALLTVLRKSIAIGTIYSPIILYWLLIGTKNLLFAVFFMWGRDNNRISARFFFASPITVQCGDRKWDALTNDVSETGLAFTLDTPEYFSDGETVSIRLEHKKYSATVTGRVVHVAQVGDRWKYSVHLHKMSGDLKRNYRQIVFDRPHPLPKKLDPSISLFDDFNLQMGKRLSLAQGSMRMLPRVLLNIPFTGRKAEPNILLDFNYRYASLQSQYPLKKKQALELILAPGIALVLAPAEIDSRNQNLYEVLNCEELAQDPAFSKRLFALSQATPAERQALRVTVLVRNIY